MVNIPTSRQCICLSEGVDGQRNAQALYYEGQRFLKPFQETQSIFGIDAS